MSKRDKWKRDEFIVVVALAYSRPLRELEEMRCAIDKAAGENTGREVVSPYLL